MLADIFQINKGTLINERDHDKRIINRLCLELN